MQFTNHIEITLNISGSLHLLKSLSLFFHLPFSLLYNFFLILIFFFFFKNNPPKKKMFK